MFSFPHASALVRVPFPTQLNLRPILSPSIGIPQMGDCQRPQNQLCFCKEHTTLPKGIASAVRSPVVE
jgi:hypothetical protein